MDDQTTPDFDVNDMVMATATNSIIRVFEFLANHYGHQYEDDVSLNKTFVKILSEILGNMLAYFPEDIKSEIVQNAFEQINYTQLMTETEMDYIQPQEGSSDILEHQKYDLSKNEMGNS